VEVDSCTVSCTEQLLIFTKDSVKEDQDQNNCFFFSIIPKILKTEKTVDYHMVHLQQKKQTIHKN